VRHGHLLQAHDQRRRAALVAALQQAQRRQQDLAQRLGRAAGARLGRATAQLDLLESRLHALDPRRVLARGYAWVTDAQGQPVLSVRGLQAGEAVRAVWADGHATARVLDVHPEPDA
jgi:exodeoxyribonuclease VII large subunit